MMELSCDQCGFLINVPEAAAGCEARCPRCQHVFVVPAAAKGIECSPKVLALVAGGVVVLLLVLFCLLKPPSRRTLCLRLRNGSREEKLTAMYMLYSKYGRGAVSQFVRAANDTDSQVASQARQMIADLGPGARKALWRILHNSKKYWKAKHQQVAAQMLAIVGDQNTATDLRRFLAEQKPEPQVRQAIIQAMLQLDPGFKKEYQKINGQWLNQHEIRERGYVQYQGEWVNAEELCVRIENQLHALQKKSSDSVECYLKQLNFLADMQAQFTQSRIREYLKDYQAKLETRLAGWLQTRLAQIQKSMKQQVGQAWKLYQHAIAVVETSGPVMAACRQRPPCAQVIQELMKAGAQLATKRLGVWIRPSVKQESVQLTEAVMLGLRPALETVGRLAYLLSSQPPTPGLTEWLTVDYKILQGRPFRDMTIRKGGIVYGHRLVCTIRYWRKGQQRCNWRDVVVAENDHKVHTPDRASISKALIQNCLANLTKKLKSWRPDFSRQAHRPVTATLLASAPKNRCKYDCIYKKKGGKLEGIILSEDSQCIHFLIVYRKKHQHTLTMKTTVARRDIARIERLSAKERQLRQQQIKALQEQKGNEAQAIAHIKLESIPWEYSRGKGYRFTSQRFILKSNASEEFTRRAVYRLEQIFKAYERYFQVTRQPHQKIQIIIFKSSAEYYAILGHNIKNPAVYIPAKKMVLAGTDLSEYHRRVAKIKEHHHELLKSLEEYKQYLKRLRGQVAAKKRAYKRQLKQSCQGKRVSQAAVNAWLKDLLRWENRQMRLIVRHEKKCRDIKNQIHNCNYRNLKLLNKYAGQLISMLYHEAFHAFLDNYLFTEENVRAVPLWLNEGLAQFFENSFIEGRELRIGTMDKRRIKLLRQYIREHKIVPLKELLVAASDKFLVTNALQLETSTIHYLESWALVTYLLEHFDWHQGTALYRYVQSLWEGGSPVEAFEDLTGMSLAEVDQAWQTKFAR